MPKVGNMEFVIRGERKKFDLIYNRSDGFSLKGFPTDVTNITESKIAFYSTESELRQSYDKRLEEYHKLIEKNKKVILYSMFMPSAKVHNKTGYGSYEGYQSWIPPKMERKISSSVPDGFGFIIKYRVVVKVENKTTKYFDIKDFEDSADLRSETFLKKEEFEIDWNESREAFFKSMELQSDLMTKKIVAFLSKDENELLQILDTGNIKLLT